MVIFPFQGGKVLEIVLLFPGLWELQNLICLPVSWEFLF